MNEKTKKQINSFFNKFKVIKYKKGQVIFKPGDKISDIVLEKSGYARAYTLSKDGKELTLPILKPLFFCSMVDMMLDKDNKYYIEAISPVELYFAPEKDFLDFIKNEDGLYDEINKTVLKNFIDLTNNVEQLVFGDAKTKIASLIYLMSERFGETKGKETIIGFNAPHRMLASITGLTRETVTLQILKLQKEGFLYNKGRKIVVRDMDKLKEISQI